MDFIFKFYSKTAFNGVFIVRLKQTHACDHGVVIDASKWSRLIYDSAEKFPHMLNPTTLLLSGRADPNSVYVSEDYQIVIQSRQKDAKRTRNGLN